MTKKKKNAFMYTRNFNPCIATLMNALNALTADHQILKAPIVDALARPPGDTATLEHNKVAL